MNLEIKRKLFVCCYDIANTSDRRLVHRIVSSFACGGQKSAYECFLSVGEQNLLMNLTKPYCQELDSFVLQPISDAKDIIVLGIANKPVNIGFLFLG
jgi:CRISPR-associated protein Cas2